MPVQLSSSDLLYFMHIPKTAGSTFYNILAGQFPPGTAFTTGPFHHFVALPPEHVARLQFVSGHFGYDVETLFGRKPIHITILRDPIQRTISHYRFVRRTRENAYYSIVRDQTLLDFITDSRTRPQVENHQLRYLTVSADLRAMAQKYSPEELEALALETEFNQLRLDPANAREQLEQAKARLQAMPFVGLTEHFDASLQLLAHTFGWWPIADYESRNVSPRDDADAAELAPDVRAALEPLLALDMELYRFGVNLFWQRYRAMVDALQAQVEAQQAQIGALQAERTAYANALNAVQNSPGWKFVLRMHNARQRFIPQGSFQERAYLSLRNRVSGRRQ